MMDNLFDVFLNSVCKYFIENFCIIPVKDIIGVYFSSLLGSLCGFGIRVMQLCKKNWDMSLYFQYCEII